MTNIAIIPARGGSKGIPRKNIKPLAGKPLIVWTIEQARAALAIDRVIVSTDDDEIAGVSRAAGAEVIMRPPELSGDEASSESALEHVLGVLAKEQCSPEHIVFLQCTSPIRPPGSIDGAFDEFMRAGADSLLSVSPSHRFQWREGPDGFGKPLNYDPHRRPRRQEMDKLFQENGSIYIFSRACFERFGNRLGGNIGLFAMDEAAGYEIDTPLDFCVVETIMKQVGAV